MGIHGLYAIVNLPCSDPVGLAADYIKGGASVIQLRDKGRTKSPEAARTFRETALALAALKRGDSLFIVNDDPELALEAGADGVHVGRDDRPVAECRKIVGSSKIIGYSSHSLEEALEAERQGADYVAFGAIFHSPTKNKEYQARRAVEGEAPSGFARGGGDASPFKTIKPVGHPVQGLERLREVVRTLRIPVVAIGGIGRDNIQKVLATGVASVAVISALAEARDHTEEAAFFSRVIVSERRIHSARANRSGGFGGTLA